jgi:hypothetical protein
MKVLLFFPCVNACNLCHIDVFSLLLFIIFVRQASLSVKCVDWSLLIHTSVLCEQKHSVITTDVRGDMRT